MKESAWLSANSPLLALRWRHELLVASYVGMEICWLTLFFLAANDRAWRFPPYASALLLGGLMLAFYGWSRIADHLRLELVQERLLVLLALPLVILLGWRLYLHPDLGWTDLSWIQAAGYDMVFGGSEGHWAIMATVLFVWWRGLSLSRREFVFDAVSFAFRLGLLLLVVGTLLLSHRVGFQVAAFIYPFFFFSLMAVALTRLEEVGQIKGYVGRLFDMYWLAVLLGAILLLLAVGRVLTVIASPAGIDAIRALWAPIGDALIEAFIWLLALVLAPFEPLLEWLASLAAGLWQSLADQGLFSNFGDIEPGFETGQYSPVTPYLDIALHAVRLVCGAGLLLALLLAGLWVLDQERQRQRELSEQHEDLEVSLLDALSGLLQQARDRLRGAAAMVGRFGVGSNLLAAISVRNIYANTTRLARKRGFPRNRAKTPYEFLPELMEAFPEAPREAQAITDAYVGVHYGELPTTREQLAELRAAYERLRSSPPPLRQQSDRHIRL